MKIEIHTLTLSAYMLAKLTNQKLWETPGESHSEADWNSV